MLRSLWRQWVTSRWMPLVLGILFCTAMFAMALLTSGKGLRQLSVTCNWRLLDSVQSWIQHGFWELGGLLSFRDTREVLTGGSKAPEVHKNQLKTLNGVVVPCMLNIMGIVLFLRLGWGIGEIGVLGCFIFFIVGLNH